MSGCEDCGRKYGDEHGFPDLIIPLYTWNIISTNGDESGLLCPSCICERLSKKGLTCYGAFMSGPIKSVSEIEMSNFRWIENIQEAIEFRKGYYGSLLYETRTDAN